MCLLFITQKFILKGEVWGKLYNFVIGFIGAKHFNFLDFGFCAAAGEEALVCAPPQRPSSLSSFFPCCTILCSIGAFLVLYWCSIGAPSCALLLFCLPPSFGNWFSGRQVNHLNELVQCGHKQYFGSQMNRQTSFHLF